jgi:sulfatase maturation enzyme AslB (radical SAM superfamily)
MKIGDVYLGIDISKAQELLEKFVSFAEDDCKFCWCVSNCRADCFGAILKNGRLSKELRRRICAIYRRATHHTMSDICRILEKNPHALDYMEKIIIS